jgi:hypothetical protein
MRGGKEADVLVVGISLVDSELSCPVLTLLPSGGTRRYSSSVRDAMVGLSAGDAAEYDAGAWCGWDTEVCLLIMRVIRRSMCANGFGG